MFTQRLEEELAAIFKCQINLDLGQARNKCELYYHLAGDVEISVSPGESMQFVVILMVEKQYELCDVAYGELTAQCAVYENRYERNLIESYDKAETPILTNQNGITIGKVLRFSYTMDYDKAQETIKHIEWE